MRQAPRLFASWLAAIVVEAAAPSGSMKSRQYKNPPIDEAICEIKFASDRPWSPVLPGLVFERLKDEYAGEPDEARVFQANLSRTQPQGVTFHDGLPLTRLRTTDATKLVMFGRDSVAVHVVRPYPGWDADFRPRVHVALAAYAEVFNPVGVRRVGLRYVNRIAIPEQRVVLDDYFSAGLVPGAVKESDTTAFMLRMQSRSGEDPVGINTTFASVDSTQPNVSTFLLDFDLFREWSSPEPYSMDALITSIDELRGRERAVFEDAITENARRLFDAE